MQLGRAHWQNVMEILQFSFGAAGLVSSAEMISSPCLPGATDLAVDPRGSFVALTIRIPQLAVYQHRRDALNVHRS